VGNPFIHIDHKKGAKYASVYIPKWQNGKKVNEIEYLGKVIDEEKSIYRNNARGLFRYTLQGGYSGLSDKSISPYTQNQEQERLILDFGPSYVFFELVKRSPFFKMISEMLPEKSGSLLSLICYKVVEHGANNLAGNWLEGSYANILFPNANLASQRVSELL
jgi:hypothetical protein